MIYKDIVNEIKRERQRGDFLFPFYGKYSVAEVVPTVLSYFKVPVSRATLPPGFLGSRMQGFRKVLFFMIDGLGYDHFLSYHEQVPFLSKLEKYGDVFPITSVFPSTTPAAFTTLHTGLTPQEHGLPEWFVYFDEVESVVETLPFRMIRTAEPNSLLMHGGTHEMLYDGATVYEQLKAAGIQSYNFIYHEYAYGAYQTAVNRGSAIVPFSYGSDLMEKLVRTLEQEPGPAYFFVYWSEVDQVEHSFGPGSREHISALTSFSELVTKRLLSAIGQTAAQDVLVMLTSDHGQSNIKGEDIIYLNRFEELTGKYLLTSKGHIIPPTGAPHDVFLSIKPKLVDEAVQFLRQELAGRAEILSISEALERGLFGLNTPSKKFLKRVGNVLILPFSNHHVWYDHFAGQPYHFKGIHGGLSQEEMLVPFAVCRLSDLIRE